jgi:hypothetical protein
VELARLPEAQLGGPRGVPERLLPAALRHAHLRELAVSEGVPRVLAEGVGPQGRVVPPDGGASRRDHGEDDEETPGRGDPRPAGRPRERTRALRAGRHRCPEREEETEGGEIEIAVGGDRARRHQPGNRGQRGREEGEPEEDDAPAAQAPGRGDDPEDDERRAGEDRGVTGALRRLDHVAG